MGVPVGDARAVARQTWRTFVDSVDRLGRPFGGETMGKAARAAMGVAFPVEGESARRTAHALAELAIAYRAATIEARRYHIGRALGATASAVGGLLDEHFEAQAEAARARIGERE